MDGEDTRAWQNPCFPEGLEDDLGEVLMSEEQCPGVYYAAVKRDGALFAPEFYLVMRESPAISHTAKSYGMPLPHHPEILTYPIGEERSGSAIIKYEAERFRKSNHLPPGEADSLHTLAVYGAEDYPEYFGDFPAPLDTPRGNTTRYVSLKNGIFMLETDQCEKLLAVCYPIWHSNFSSYVIRHAEQTGYDRGNGIDNTLGYLFFPYETACLAIFELLEENPDLATSGKVDLAALQNTIWRNFPKYAVEYNKAEQAGMHDVMGMLLNFVGADVEPTGSVEEMMRITLEAGTDFLKVDI